MSNNHTVPERFSKQSILAFTLAFAVCTTLISVAIWNRVSVERLTMEQLIIEKSVTLTEVISKLLYKTNALSALVIQGDGDIESFERVASTIIDNDSILNVLMAPGGVVSHVFPLQGNEAVLGLDFLSEGAGNKEAILAKESGQLVFGGPFTLVQGGQALVGRLPVFLGNSADENEFWGLVSITLKYPQVLESVGLDSLQTHNLAFEIWRINPDDDEKQIIASSGYSYAKNANYIEREINFSNATWFFRILPIRAWYEYPETWLMIVISLCASAMVAMIIHNNYTLRLLKVQLEHMAHTDPLTGAYNRRFFMETAIMQIERAMRLQTSAYVILFDLDHFKQINDKYGHLIGDLVLVETTQRIKHNTRAYDLLARYGGEEFILLVTDISAFNLEQLTYRLKKSLCDIPVIAEGETIPYSASFGVAPVSQTQRLEQAIDLADGALYKAKEAGRNRVFFCDENGNITAQQE